MVSHRQPRLIPLGDAARLSERTPAALGRWCATGRLRCERVGHEWLVLEDDLHVAATLEDLPNGWRDRAVLSIAFPDEGNGRRAYEQLRSRFGLGPENLGLAPLALDGASLVLVAGVFPAVAIPVVLDLVRELGGIIVDGVDETRVDSGSIARERERRESSYG